METYRKINQWTSHSRDMVESFKRYYNNSFLDRQRQEAYNLFLGNYIFAQGQPMLWDLPTDYYLHHTDPKSWSTKTRKSYVNWFTPKNLECRVGFDTTHLSDPFARKPLRCFDDYWLEYYRPLALSSFQKMFTFRMNSTLRYIPFKSTQEGKYDLSPFRARSGNEHESPEKGRSRKEVMIVDPKQDGLVGDDPLTASYRNLQLKAPALPSWVDTHLQGQSPSPQGSINPPSKTAPKPLPPPPPKAKPPKDQSAPAQWTLDQFVSSSLNPSVTATEAHEYRRYITHPLHLPLVTSTGPDPTTLELNSRSIITSVPSTAADDIVDFTEFLDVGDEPLTVTEADPAKKRYKAYRQWLKGKSLFKQQRVDP